MEEMKKTELVFIPSPQVGHLYSTIEVAKLLTDRNKQFSITVLIMRLPSDTKPLPESSHPGINLVELKRQAFSPQQGKYLYSFFFDFIDSHKGPVREILADITDSKSSILAGIVIDMFCSSMIDVANEFGIPSYLFFTSGAAYLGLMFHLQSLRDDFKIDVTEFKDSDSIPVPTYKNSVPPNVLPSIIFDKNGGCDIALDLTKRYRETKGIIINTFLHLESHAMKALLDDKTIPPVYATGPILTLNQSSDQSPESELILKWLDLQPDSSVVFLCFGSKGTVGDDQVKEIAYALEHSGHPFLWSLRKPPPKGKIELPGNYENPEEVLPEGFLDRTAELGKVVGWVPQVAVLSHPAIGGFVSHCGWNSTLESVWCGVPMATWPLSAEQQVNAFLLVKELEMAVEIKMDYRYDIQTGESEILSAALIENGIKYLMDPENEIRSKVRQMKAKSTSALTEEGSSSASLSCFLNNVADNIHF